MNQREGFTLVELLITVLIVGVLVSIAVPQYQRSVLKSRYSALMPIAKAVADGNEAFYLTHGRYAIATTDLDITSSSVDSNEADIELNDEEDYSYVMVQRADVPNNKLVVYQKRSPQFADTIHCEAYDEDEKATWLCHEGLHGTPLEGSLTGEDWTAYAIAGNFADSYFVKPCEDLPETEHSCSSGCGMLTRRATCNGREGAWDYEGEFDEDNCPQKLPVETGACENGQIGTRKRGSVCNEDGTAYERGEWSDDRCFPNNWYGRGLLYALTIKDAQEDYYAAHGRYATTMAQLGLSNLSCPADAYTCKLESNGSVRVGYLIQVVGNPNRKEEAQTFNVFYDNSSHARRGGVYCWGSPWSGYGGVPGQRCREAGGTAIPGTESYVISGNSI